MTLVASLFGFDNEALCNWEHDFARPITCSSFSLISRGMSIIFAVGGKNVPGSVILKSFLMLAYSEECCYYFSKMKMKRYRHFLSIFKIVLLNN